MGARPFLFKKMKSSELNDLCFVIFFYIAQLSNLEDFFFTPPSFVHKPPLHSLSHCKLCGPASHPPPLPFERLSLPQLPNSASPSGLSSWVRDEGSCWKPLPVLHSLLPPTRCPISEEGLLQVSSYLRSSLVKADSVRCLFQSPCSSPAQNQGLQSHAQTGVV